MRRKKIRRSIKIMEIIGCNCSCSRILPGVMHDEITECSTAVGGSELVPKSNCGKLEFRQRMRLGWRYYAVVHNCISKTISFWSSMKWRGIWRYWASREEKKQNRKLEKRLHLHIAFIRATSYWSSYSSNRWCEVLVVVHIAPRMRKPDASSQV